MATQIFHGAPGSYKSSTAMWFEVLPALRDGRIVVTNLQGIKSVEEISDILEEVFPETARVFRISTSSDKGMDLIRNFYQWLPIGCFLFIDEIQDIYPNDSSFKALNYNYKGEGAFDDVLPDELIAAYHKEQREIKNNVNIDDYTDDLGESLFDERDYLRYPRTLREAFMRHRHHNWDIVLATPDIKEVTGFIRSVCETAFLHTSKDSIPIPYYKRRPMITEHSPKKTGLESQKSKTEKFQKVPLNVFKLYKSTATGKNTKSGLGGSPFTFVMLCSIFGFLACLVFMGVNIASRFTDDKSKSTDINVPKQVYDLPTSDKLVTKKPKNNTDILKENSPKATSFTYRDANVSAITSPSNFVDLPFSAQKIYISAVVSVKNHGFTNYDFIFNLYIDDEVFSVSDEELKKIGFKVFYKNECLTELRNDVRSYYVYCEPRKNLDFIAKTDNPSVINPVDFD